MPTGSVNAWCYCIDIFDYLRFANFLTFFGLAKGVFKDGQVAVTAMESFDA